jgi:hypothetical protein
VSLIAPAIAFATQPTPSTTVVDPSAFRRQVGLSQMCITSDEQQPAKIVWLNLTPGENLPDIALTRSGTTKNPVFEAGIVTETKVDQDADGYHTAVVISGKAAGAAAKLKLLIFTANNAKGVLALELSSVGKTRRFSCVPVPPPPPSGNTK